MKEIRKGQSISTQMQIDKDNMRVEYCSTTGDRTATLFDSAKQTLRMLNTSKKTYTELTKDAVQQLKQRLDSAKAALQAKLASVPEAQRQLIEQMMHARGSAPSTLPKIEYRPVGSDNVGSWVCTRYEGFAGQQKVAEVCTVDFEELDLSSADFEITRQFADFMKPLMPASADTTNMSVADCMIVNDGYPGIAVRRVAFQDGMPSGITEIMEVRRETLPASTFETPEGFSKQALPIPGSR
jgi:hypothetical protein